VGYTPIHYAETTRPLVAVFEFGQSTQAMPILGVALYRDLSSKDGENVLVPCTVRELDMQQTHYEYSRRDLTKRLPSTVVESARLLEAVLAAGDGESVEVAMDATTGSYRVVAE
jgi:hypothetical protein